MMEKPRRRIINIIRKMTQGDDFYTNDSPRISRAEITEVEKLLDVLLQIEHTHGAQPGPIAVYPLHRDAFRERAKPILESIIKHRKRST